MERVLPPTLTGNLALTGNILPLKRQNEAGFKKELDAVGVQNVNRVTGMKSRHENFCS